ncbi:PAS domain S-box protein [Sunxiuqinia elliptica]
MNDKARMTEEKLQMKIQQLSEEQESLKEVLNEVLFKLEERKKEIECHNAISRLMQTPSLSIEEVIQEIVKVVPQSWQFPDFTHASIKLNGQVFNSSGNSKKTYVLTQPIVLEGRQLGEIKVSHNAVVVKNRTPFLVEEEVLLKAIAERISSFIKYERERELQEQNKQKYQILVENINDAIFETDENGVLTYVSPQIEQVTGYTPSELVGQLFYSKQEHLRGILEERFRVLQKKGGIKNDYEFLTKTGTTCWVRISSKAKYIDGQFCGALGTVSDISEKKKLELELTKSEWLYRSMMDASPDIVTIADIHGQIILTSPKTLEVFGHDSVDYFTGRNVWDFIKSESKEKCEATFKCLLVGDRINVVEFKAIKSDGTTFYIEVSANLIRNEEGKPHRIIIITRDITARKQAENQMLKLSLAVEQSPASIVITNIDGDIEYVNPKTCQTTGYAADELIGKNPRILKSGETSEDEYEYLWRSISHGETWQGIFHNKRKNGDFYWESAQITPIKNDAGELLGYFGVKEDVTDYKNIQEALLRSEERFKQVAEHSQTVVWEVDENGLYTYVGGAVKRVWGYLPEEIVGKKHFYDLHPEKGRKEFKRAAFKFFKDKKIITNLENQVVPKDGDPRWMLTNGIPILDKEGQFLGYRGSDLNINEKKQADKALKASETMLNNAQELAQMGSWEFNIINNEVNWSKNFYKLMEVTENDRTVSFDYFSDRIHPEDKGLLDEELETLIEQKKATSQQHRLLMPDGKVKWVENRIVPDFDSRGNLIALKGINLDITAKKMVEQELVKREEKLYEAQKLAQICSWEHSFKDHSTIWSDNTYDLYQIDRKLVQPSYEYILENRIHPDDVHFFVESVEQIHQDPQELSYDSRIVLPGGEIRWMTNEIVPVLENGELVGLSGINQDITDKKETELAITNQNNRMNAALRAIPDLIFIMRDDGTYLEYYANKEEELLLSPGNIVGSNIADAFPAEAARFHLDKFRECLRRKELINYNYSIPINGSELFFEARISPVDNHSVLVLARNITSEREQEVLLKRLSLAVKQSPVITVITDLKANVEYVNPVFERITGYSLAEIIGKNVRILQSGETPRAVYNEMWKTIKAGTSWHGEWKNRKKNGEKYWEDVIITPITDDDGQVMNYLAVKQDVTDRKKADLEIFNLNQNLEEKIKQRTKELEKSNRVLKEEIEKRKKTEHELTLSQQNYRNVVENVKEIIFKTDLEGNWLFLNQAWEEITGFTVDESIGERFMNYVYPDDRQRNWELFEPLIQQEKAHCKHEVRYLTKDGSYIWVEVFARLGLDEDNQIIGTYGTLQDITVRKRAENFEREVLDLSANFTGISFNEIDGALNVALERIGQFLTADRAYIFEIDNTQALMSNTYEWCNHGVLPEISNLKDIPVDIFPMWMKQLKSGNAIIIPSVANLPESWHAEKAILEPQGIQSLVVLPMYEEERLIGFVGLDLVKHQREFLEIEIKILNIWGTMLSNLVYRKQTEFLLEQTRQNHETFYNTVDDFLYILNDEWKIIDMNLSMCNRLGYLKEELQNRPIKSLLLEEQEQQVENIFDSLLEGQTDYCTIPMVTKGGNKIPVETKLKRGFWDGQSVVFGASKDISKLRLSEEKFSTAFHSNSGLMAISDIENGLYLDVNNAFLEAVEFSREELIGKKGTELGLFPDPGFEARILDKVEKEKSIRKYEVNWRTKSGVIRIGLLSADTIFIGDRKCMLSVTIDITERKRAEEEASKARIEAEEANRAKSEFLSRMSHELRTPMNSILGFGQLLEMGELKEPQKRGVKHIMQSGKHLLNLINEVLDISRIEAGRLELSIEPVSLENAIYEIIDLVQPQVERNSLNLRFVVSESSRMCVMVDRQRFKQIMLNLVNNAIKYNKSEGSATIETQRIGKGPKKMIRIFVRDTGPGISEEDIEKLFTPFERIGAEKTRTEGTGLGLAVVKKLTEAMAGRVGLTSKKGEGSTFWVEFPLGNTKGKCIKEQSEEATTIAENSTIRGKALYVEDDSSNVELVRELLENQRPNIELVSCGNGAEALNIALMHKPDIIFMVNHLSGLSGGELLRQFGANEKLAGVPVVVISADAMPKQIIKMLQLGAKDYLTKPLDILAFLRVLDRFLENGEAGK